MCLMREGIVVRLTTIRRRGIVLSIDVVIVVVVLPTSGWWWWSCLSSVAVWVVVVSAVAATPSLKDLPLAGIASGFQQYPLIMIRIPNASNKAFLQLSVFAGSFVVVFVVTGLLLGTHELIVFGGRSPPECSTILVYRWCTVPGASWSAYISSILSSTTSSLSSSRLVFEMGTVRLRDRRCANAGFGTNRASAIGTVD